MNAYRKFFHAPLDPFGDYKYDEKSQHDHDMLMNTSHAIREMSKMCY